MACSQRVLDVFVTKGDNDYSSDGLDETFMAPVMSVEIHHNSVGGQHWRAEIVNWPTPWIITADHRVRLDLEVGDLVRIGDVGNASGFSDYATVLQKLQVDQIDSKVRDDNGAEVAVSYAPLSVDISHLPVGTVATNYVAHYNDLPSSLTANQLDTNGYLIRDGHASCNLMAYRLNVNLDATTPPTPLNQRGNTKNDILVYSLQKRAQLHLNKARYAEALDATTVGSTEHNEILEQTIPHPLFKVNRWKQNSVTITLDRGVKMMNWIKLVGYSFFNKQQGGFQSAHDLKSDDWFALHIKEVPGAVQSNNSHAAGAFCVLHAGSATDHITGAVEFHQHDMNGLHAHHFTTPQNVHQLHFELLDRNGMPANFGRVHLWFKVCVSHG